MLITAAKMDVAPPNLVLFRNYQLPEELLKEDKYNEVKIYFNFF